MNLHIGGEYGGPGIGTTLGCIIKERLAYGCSGILTCMESNALTVMPIMMAGNEEQKRRGCDLRILQIVQV